MNSFLSLVLSLALATSVFANLPEEDVVAVFFANYDSVWPGSTEKLAYTFLASHFDVAGTDSASLVVTDDIYLNPKVKPDADTQSKLESWLENSSFDSTIQYDSILKSFQEDTDDFTTSEIMQAYQTIKGASGELDEILPQFGNARTKRGCSPSRCLENFHCISQGSGCVCGGGPLRMDCKSLY